MKKNYTTFLLLALGSLILSASGCKQQENTGNPPENPALRDLVTQLDRAPFYEENPEKRTAATQISSEALRLSFFGWGEENDYAFQLNLPEEVSNYNRVILEYRMGGWGIGPGEWDNTTMLFIRNKATGERYELARAISPYGGYFDQLWSKSFYLDVTEFLPMLSGETQFYLYYGGWDATDLRAHTVTLTLYYYEGAPERNMIFSHKLYDTSRDGNSGYRAWAYGVEGHDIEDESRLGRRTVEIPEEVKSLEMRVAITGHGHDKGKFTERDNYRTNNAAEFDENFYEIVYNDVVQNAEGHIFYSNADNYEQAGTYYYDRANWAPGNPINLQFWNIAPHPEKGYGTITLDLNLEAFESKMKETNAEGVAQYIIEIDLFGYDK